MSCGKKRDFPCILPFIAVLFPPTHVHMEHSDWLDSVKVTSGGRFGYLSARRSQLTTFLRNHSSRTVSTLTCLHHLTRRSRHLGCPLPEWRNFGPAVGGDLTPGALAYMVVKVQDGALIFPALDLLSFGSRFSQHIWVRAVK